MSLNTLLFDLDGTLLPMDLDAFMKAYFGKIVPHVHHLMNPETVVPEIWKATQQMIVSEDSTRTNEQIFKDVFFASVDVKEEVIWPVFEDFYRTVFGELKSYTQPTPLARQICETALDKGYQLAVATNPLFPAIAVEHRLNWAGVGDIPFRLVTSMENMHYCKPNPKYYIEILDMLGVAPADAMMFGNDIQEDGVAGKIGMQTYLVTDYLIDHQHGHFHFDEEGSLADALRFLQSLPSASPTTT